MTVGTVAPTEAVALPQLPTLVTAPALDGGVVLRQARITDGVGIRKA